MDPRTVKTAGSSSDVLVDGDAPSSSAAAPATAAPTSSASSSSAADAPTAAGNADAAPSAPAVVTPATLLEGLKAQREWTKAIAFDAAGKIIAATVQPLDGEMACVSIALERRPTGCPATNNVCFTPCDRATA